MAADRRLGPVGLRPRVAAVAVVAVGVALTLGAVALVGLLRSRLETASNTAATLRARDVAALATADALPRQLALPGEESAFVQVIDATGAVVASTENIDGEPAIMTRRPTGAGALEITMVVTPLGDAKTMRIVALNADTERGRVTVYAGESLEAAEDTTTAVIAGLVAGVLLLLAIVAAVTWWAVGRTLRPVHTITQTLAEITTTDLHRRVPTSTGRDEIGQLATTVNETLARLDASVEQQRRFVADASHELRGPLAALRADLEISVTHPDRTEWQIVARDTLGDVERLQRLTDDLLLLARLDARKEHPRQGSLDLAVLVAEATRAIRRDDVTVDSSGLDAPVVIDGDIDQLRRMLRNLVHNAEEHARAKITVSLAIDHGTAVLGIADDGPGIPIEERERVFGRFVRLDTARTRDTAGTGLGLAIVHDVVNEHGGRVTITDTIPLGATVTVELPTTSA